MSEHIKLVSELKDRKKETKPSFKEFNRAVKDDPESLLSSLGSAALFGIDEEVLPKVVKDVLDATDDGRRIGFSPEANELMWAKIFDDPRHTELRHQYADQERNQRTIAAQLAVEYARGDSANPEALQQLANAEKEAQNAVDSLSRQRAIISLGVMVAENVSRIGTPLRFSDYVDSMEFPTAA